MKHTIAAVLALGLSGSFAFAFDVPRGIHGMEALADARAKAAERPEPVAFVITKMSLKET